LTISLIHSGDFSSPDFVFVILLKYAVRLSHGQLKKSLELICDTTFDLFCMDQCVPMPVLMPGEIYTSSVQRQARALNMAKADRHDATTH